MEQLELVDAATRYSLGVRGIVKGTGTGLPSIYQPIAEQSGLFARLGTMSVVKPQ